MELLILVTGTLLFVLGLFAGFVHAHASDAERKDDAWSTVAERLRLRRAEHGVEGRLAGHAATMGYQVLGKGKAREHRTFARIAAAPEGLALVRPSAFSWFEGFEGGDVTVGDPDFDQEYVVQGEPACLAWFDAPVRALARGRFALEVARGQVTLVARGELTDADALAELWATAESLALLWFDGRTAAERLADSLRTEPLASARRTRWDALRALDPERARALAPALLDHDDPMLRVGAAAALGDARALLDHVDARFPPEVAAAALRALGPLGPDRLAADALRKSLLLDDEAVRLAAVALAASRPAAARALLEGLAPEPWEGRAGKALVALVRDHPDALPLLRPWLKGTDAEVTTALAERFAAEGTVDDIPALTDGLEAQRPVIGAAGPLRDAIRAIRARAEGTPGELALAHLSDHLGALSLAAQPIRVPSREPH